MGSGWSFAKERDNGDSRCEFQKDVMICKVSMGFSWAPTLLLADSTWFMMDISVTA